MSYDADPRSIMRRVSDWGAGAVITRDDYAAVESLIMRHVDERGRVFEEMVNTLKREAEREERSRGERRWARFWPPSLRESCRTPSSSTMGPMPSKGPSS